MLKIILRMKKSLAIKLERSGPSAPKRKLLTRSGQGSMGNKGGKSNLKLDISTQRRSSVEKQGEQKIQSIYRNKNLSTLPASLLNTISSLTCLDISHNKLTDSQIQLLMNSCPKLETLCIQDNMTSLIPLSISRLKNLEQFRHDWVKLFDEHTYEPEENLNNIQVLAKKGNTGDKSQGVVGINFQSYCLEILKIELDESLPQKIQESKCSDFAKRDMLQAIRIALKLQKDEENTDIEGIDSSRRDSAMAGTFSTCGFDPETQHKPKETKLKEYSSRNPQQREPLDGHSSMKMENIRDMRETEMTTNNSSMGYTQIPDIVYQHKDMPLHMLFSKYDKNPRGSIDIDRLLLKGYNPNTYDQNGLSAYHIIVIFRQEIALERLLEISFKNPGFFDLQMPSMKEGRNILHFSVFLKDYAFTKTLIDFGLPVDKRDYSGARLVHLVDQNYEFLILLRKALRKKYESMRTPSFFTYPEPMARKYCRHPPRVAQESNYQTFENKNLNLMQMYEAAVGMRGNRT